MQYADPDCAPSYITITFDLEGDSLERLLNRKFRTPQKAVLLLQQMLRERDREDRYTGDMLISLLGPGFLCERLTPLIMRMRWWVMPSGSSGRTSG